jgi:hypothetical protein
MGRNEALWKHFSAAVRALWCEFARALFCKRLHLCFSVLQDSSGAKARICARAAGALGASGRFCAILAARRQLARANAGDCAKSAAGVLCV